MQTERLARCFEEAAGIASDDRAALERRLTALFDAGRAAWPGVALAPEAFIEHLARHAARTGAPLGLLEGVHASDLFLACAVLHRDRAALAAFEAQFMSRVPEYVMRVRVGRDVVDEVQQAVRDLLLVGRVDPDASGAASGGPKIGEYSGKGALGGWLRVTAVRVALNHVRASQRPLEPLRDETPSFAADPELSYLREHARELFVDAFTRVLRDLDATERTMLRLHHVEGLTMDQLSHMYKTPRSTIARRLDRVREQIFEATEAVLRDERGLSPSAVVSIIRDARSHLQVTMTHLLR